MQSLTLLPRHQIRVFARDGRARAALWVVGALLVTGLVTDISRQQQLQRQQLQATVGDSLAWVSQGETHPHDAAHFGRYAFRPDGPLAMLDPGVSDYVGSSVRLEAHRRHPAVGRRVEAGTVLSAFPTPSVAFVLQALLPLLIVFAGFTMFADEEVRGTARLELSMGIAPQRLVAGRSLGLLILALLPVALVACVAVGTLAMRGASMDDYARLVGFIGGTALYLLTFVAITVASSLRASSARQALIVLLGVWATSVWLAPRLAPSIVERLHPAATMESIDDAVADETRRRRTKDDPTSRRLAEVTDSLMRVHRVANVAQLPLNMGGVSLLVEEEMTTTAYNKYFAQVFADYESQLHRRRWFTMVSPFIPLTHWSTAMAGTDLAAQKRFLDAADRYRYNVVQSLNRESRDRGGSEGSAYVTDLDRLGLDEPFRLTQERVIDVVRRRLVDILLLVAWAVMSCTLALRSAARLSTTP